ncbi:MAG: flagellar basal body P-ring protein FlgI [Nitrospinae bacterium]|nr:flagellar basal body P-ring protein FlgI [Nitrospinota bacterium]
MKFIGVMAVVLLAFPAAAGASRIKDISNIQGMRQNQLIGYGLMVGLKNSGDRTSKTPFTAQTLVAMLKRLGTTVDIRQLTGPQIGVSQTRFLRDVKVENVAAVMVTATLSPFSKPGTKLDVSVSSLGDAKSLEGGTLLMTPLKAPNGEVYAVAQGALAVTRKNGKKGSNVEVVPTTGTIPDGAIVEKEVPNDFAQKSQFNILLSKPDFATASSMVAAVNGKYGKDTARGLDAGTVEVQVPAKFAANPFGFMSEVEVLNVTSDMPARVVLDEKSGTVVIGDNVEIHDVAISFADITLQVRNGANAPAQAPKEKITMLKKNTSITDLVAALNALGVSPQDLVAIFRSLHASGALNAEMEVL